MTNFSKHFGKKILPKAHKTASLKIVLISLYPFFKQGSPHPILVFGHFDDEGQWGLEVSF